ncbi:MAG: type II secretion system protein GspJ [Verrucomicrobiales bacterium]
MKLSPSPSMTLAGFTLLELLLAMVVFAVVVMAVNSIFYGALRLRNKTNDSVTRSVEVEHALKTIKRDLANIVPPGGTMTGELQTQTVGGMSGANRPVMYTSTGLMNEVVPFGQVQKVSYTVAAGGEFSASGKDLYRNITRNLLPQTQEDMVSELLLSGVESLTFQYYDGTQWRNSWDSATETTKLPLAIKAQLILGEGGESRVLPQPIELVVPITVTASTNQTSTTTTQRGDPE